MKGPRPNRLGRRWFFRPSGYVYGKAMDASKREAHKVVRMVLAAKVA